MPNWVVNRITVKGENAEEIIKSHFIKNEEGEDAFDFNTIVQRPKDLDIEKGYRSAQGLKLYIAKINPLIPNLGEHEDKMLPMQKFIDKMIKMFGYESKDHLDMFILKPSEIEQLRKEFKDGFNDAIDLGEKAFHNIENYGYPDWYDWSIKNWGTKWNACNSFISLTNPTVLYFDTAWTPAVPVVEKFAKMHPELQITHEFAEEQTGMYSGKLEYENGAKKDATVFESFSKEAYEMSFDLWGCEEEYVFDKTKNNYVYRDDYESNVDSEM